ncbi:hypothetical protein V6N12_059050 [Hibiscus sabdariffa]|uniref:Uncharacterized protein n=1 Tax=Hibiscus sabdariffa TaxID=183260 RepID=A0ABR2EUI1_9ROSI
MGHLKDLNAAVKLCECALVAVDSPQYMKLGPNQEAHVYWENAQSTGLNTSLSESQSTCSAFLANIDEHNTTTITFCGSITGHWVKVVQPTQFQQGYNDLILLYQTVGLQNYDLSKASWTYQVGLKGEFQKIFTVEETEKAEWIELKLDSIPSTFTWYKAYFDSGQHWIFQQGLLMDNLFDMSYRDASGI